MQDFVKIFFFTIFFKFAGSFKVTRDLYFTKTTLLSTDSLKDKNIKNTHFMAGNYEFLTREHFNGILKVYKYSKMIAKFMYSICFSSGNPFDAVYSDIILQFLILHRYAVYPDILTCCLCCAIKPFLSELTFYATSFAVTALFL